MLYIVYKYISFFNHERFQKKLNNLSPYQYRTWSAQIAFLLLSIRQGTPYLILYHQKWPF
ncbi:IS3 family transposase [Priestia megaterium]|uniref:IS3 family transposase n=1 Tax=Priestia megaterium TaxID=1404 RepID=UPI0037C51997